MEKTTENSPGTQIRPPVEARYEKELLALAASDAGARPLNWKLSPRAVRDFILGSRKPLSYNGEEIAIHKKYLGNDALVERCIITLAGKDRKSTRLNSSH